MKTSEKLLDNPPNIIPSFGIMCSRRWRRAITITFHFHPTKRRINHANAPPYQIWRFTNRNYQTTAIHETNYRLLPPTFSHFDFNLRKGVRDPPSHAAGTRGNCYYFPLKLRNLRVPGTPPSQKGKFTFETSAAAFPAAIVTVNF